VSLSVGLAEYAVRLLPVGGDLGPVMRMRRDWVASSILGEVPPAGTSSLDWDPTYPGRFRRWWEREGDSRRTWLVWRGLDPVGMANVKIFERMPKPDAQGSRWVYVANVWVDPPHRRRGVGTMLIRHVADWARTEGMVRLVLSPRVESVAMYEALGFRPAGDMLRMDLDTED